MKTFKAVSRDRFFYVLSEKVCRGTITISFLISFIKVSVLFLQSKIQNMDFKTIAEDILGRGLDSNDGINLSVIEEEEKRLGVVIPDTLREFYQLLGGNLLFADGFQHFAQVNELFIKDDKLVFLQENQSVVYWAIDLKDGNTVVQTEDQDFSGVVEWVSEEFELSQFLEMMLYFQCVMSDENYHREGRSGFEYLVSLDEEPEQNFKTKAFIEMVDEEWTKVVSGSGLSIYWHEDCIVLCFLNSENEVGSQVLSCVKKEEKLDELIDLHGFGQL